MAGMSDLRPGRGDGRDVGDHSASSGRHGERWWPPARVVLPEHDVEHPAVPAIDIHNHVGRWLSDDGSLLGGTAAELAATLDEAGVSGLVNLDGRWGDELDTNIATYDRALPERVVTFCHVDWSALALDDARGSRSVEQMTTALADSAARGARGVKVWKDLGLEIRDATGALVLPDDPRVVAVLRAAGELGLPVLIHTADPVAFFKPLDDDNERMDELSHYPRWWFGGDGFPTFERLIGALHSLVEACPATTFVGAHVGGHAEDLGAVGAALGRLPNLHVDTGGRLGELGRQPRMFRRLVEAFPERVLFGSDCFPPDVEMLRLWWRFFETDDEHFGYVPRDAPPPQGRWRISAANLPRTLLSAVYRDNAMRVLGR
jgi:hypothetical protein